MSEYTDRDRSKVLIPVPHHLSGSLRLRYDAYAKLGVPESEVKKLPRITPHIRQIQRQLRRAGNGPQVAIGPMPNNLARFPTNPYYFLSASADPDARKVLESYYSLNKTFRDSLPIEAFCLASGVSTLRVLEIITATCVRLGAQAASMIAAVAHPRVVEKTIAMALTDEGHEDRSVLHKATGFLPSPKGAHTNITVTQNAQANATAQAASIAAPPPEQTIRRFVDRFNDARQLHSPAQPALPADVGHEKLPETMPHESYVDVEVEAESGEEEDES